MYSKNFAVNVSSNVYKMILLLDGFIIPNYISPNLVSENSGAQCTNRGSILLWQFLFELYSQRCCAYLHISDCMNWTEYSQISTWERIKKGFYWQSKVQTFQSFLPLNFGTKVLTCFPKRPERVIKVLTGFEAQVVWVASRCPLSYRTIFQGFCACIGIFDWVIWTDYSSISSWEW